MEVTHIRAKVEKDSRGNLAQQLTCFCFLFLFPLVYYFRVEILYFIKEEIWINLLQEEFVEINICWKIEIEI